MRKEEIPFLYQLVKAFDEAEFILEEAYMRNDVERFEEAKKFMMELQKKINEVTI